jgi:hypothetical protein
MIEHDFTHQRWGHAIHDINDSHICAHSTPLPVEGDVILRKMQSGKVGRFELSNFKTFSDPRDMWSADVKFVGYKDEVTA